MALSYVTYPGNGASTNFSVTFGYIAQSDVSVYVDGVLQTLTTDYVWFNSTTIQFLVAPAGGTVIRIQRDTESTVRLVDFQDAGNLTEADLDLSANQLFYLVQEGLDDFSDLSLQLDTDNKWDAESKIIKNVADPVSAQDAMTLNYMETTFLTSIQASQAAAAASAAAALVSETNAAASEASAAADAVSTAADAVSTAADAASTAADAIATAADRVQTGLDAAATAADAIATAADRVQTGLDATATAADVVQTGLDAAATAADAISTAADAAATAADVVTVEGIYDSFDDRYLGAKASDPALDNDGNALLTGALYWNTTSSVMRVYNGAAWETSYHAYPSLAGNALKFLQVNSGATAEAWFDLFGSSPEWTGQHKFTNSHTYLSQAAGVNSNLWLQEDGNDKGVLYHSTAGHWIALRKYTDADDTIISNEIRLDDSGDIEFRYGSGLAVKMTVNNTGVDIADTLRAQGGTTPPSTGAGLEMAYIGSAGYIQAYNRGTPAWSAVHLRGSVVYLSPTGTAALTLTNALMDITTNIRSSGTNFLIYRTNDTGATSILGGSGWAASSGAYVSCYGTSHATYPGLLTLVPGTGAECVIYNSGTVASLSTWSGKGIEVRDLYLGDWTGGSAYKALMRKGGGTNNYMIMANTTDTLISTPSAAGSIYLRPGINGVGCINLNIKPTKYEWGNENQVVYMGRISSGGAWVKQPASWTVSRTVLGQYDVTHNLGYYPVVTATVEATVARNCYMAHLSTNQFRIYVCDMAGTAYDGPVSFSAGAAN